MQTAATATSKAASTWASASLHALAREEHHGRRPKRLLEPGRLTWSRFRGHLGPVDLLCLLLEDAAVTQSEPFDVALLPPEARPTLLSADLADALLAELATRDLTADPDTYLTEQARLLGLPTRFGRSSLRKVANTKQVLELPGTGGQLAFHITRTQPGVYLQDVFTIGYDGWRERTLAGLVAVEAGLRNDQLRLAALPSLDALRTLGRRFDQVIGLHPDRGGLFPEAVLHETVLVPGGDAVLI